MLMIDKSIYCYSPSLQLSNSLNIVDLKNAMPSGRYSLFVKFYSTFDEKLKIKLFSRKERDVILDILFPDSEGHSEKIRDTLILLHILKKDRTFFAQLLNSFVNHARKTGVLYYPVVYDMLMTHDHSKAIKLPLLILVLTSSSLLQRVNRVLFSQVRCMKYKTKDLERMITDILQSYRKHRDSIDTTPKKRRTTVTKMELYESKIKEDASNESLDTVAADISFELAPRPRNLRYGALDNRFNTVYKRNTNVSKLSMDSSNLGKAVYDKISFNIAVAKYIGKEQKVLDIQESGVFSIYKKGKVIRYLTSE